MKVASGILGMAVMMSSGWSTFAAAQSTEPAVPDHTDHRPTHTFYLKNVTAEQQANDILTGLRLIIEPDMKLYLLSSQNAIVMRGSAAQIELAQKLIDEMDRPKKDYRVTFTVDESDAGKKIGSQHFAMTIASGARSTLREGSKVPIATGSYDNKEGSQTQFTYLDVGLNLDVTLTDFSEGVSLKYKAEQSAVQDEKVILNVREPVIRQTTLEDVAITPLGKSTVLGSMDVPGSTRHLDISVIVDPVK